MAEQLPDYLTEISEQSPRGPNLFRYKEFVAVPFHNSVFPLRSVVSNQSVETDAFEETLALTQSERRFWGYQSPPEENSIVDFRLTLRTGSAAARGFSAAGGSPAVAGGAQVAVAGVILFSAVMDRLTAKRVKIKLYVTPDEAARRRWHDQIQAILLRGTLAAPLWITLLLIGIQFAWTIASGETIQDFAIISIFLTSFFGSFVFGGVLALALAIYRYFRGPFVVLDNYDSRYFFVKVASDAFRDSLPGFPWELRNGAWQPITRPNVQSDMPSDTPAATNQSTNPPPPSTNTDKPNFDFLK